VNTICQKSTSLWSTLSQRHVPALRELAKSYYVSGYSRMKKAELVASVFEALLDMTRMTEILYVTDPRTWKLFQRLADDELVRVTRSTPPQYKLLVELGYLDEQRSDTDTWIFMPDEIRAVYADLAMGGLPEQKELFDLIHTYAQAAVHLYGVIGLVDFAALFNGQNEPKLTPGEMVPALLRHISVDAEYRIWEDYLISESYQDDPRQTVPALLARVGGTPRYIPERKELLRYASADYVEETAHTERLRQYLADQLRMKKAQIQEAVTLIHYGCQLGASPESATGVFERYPVKISASQHGEIVGLLRRVFDTTRLPALNGHTAEEMRSLAPAVSVRQKIGRNDPCPCGSGRKYKKCCGR